MNDNQSGLPEYKNRLIEKNYIKEIFASRLGAVSTETYLRDPDLVYIVSSIIQPHAQAEIVALEKRLTMTAEFPSVAGLRVAITNIALDGFAGSELWTLEMASYLTRVGIETLVYSPQIGRVARKFADKGFTITDEPRTVGRFEPNVLHIHHQAQTSAARAAVGSDCATVNMIHGLLPTPEWPGKGMDKYVAVSLHAKAKAALLGPAAWKDISVLPNFFDPGRFTVPKKRKRLGALIHSSRTTPSYVENIQNTLIKLNISLDQIGYGSIVHTKPEEKLPNYSIVFAVGRSAIEAMACGCRVILWDHGIIGPAITLANFWYALATNFSVASGVLPVVMPDDPSSEEWLASQISIEDDVEGVTILARKYLSIDSIGRHLVDMYGDCVKFVR